MVRGCSGWSRCLKISPPPLNTGRTSSTRRPTFSVPKMPTAPLWSATRKTGLLPRGILSTACLLTALNVLFPVFCSSSRHLVEPFTVIFMHSAVTPKGTGGNTASPWNKTFQPSFKPTMGQRTLCRKYLFFSARTCASSAFLLLSVFDLERGYVVDGAVFC